MKLRARPLAVVSFLSILGLMIAGVYSCGSDEPAGGGPGPEAGADGTTGGPDGGGSSVGDGSAPAVSCADFAAATAATKESVGTAVLQGGDVNGTFCARVKVRSGSYNHQSPSDLVLEMNGLDNSYAFTTPSAVGGRLLVYIGLNTDTAGTSASTDPNQCGSIFTAVRLTPTAEDQQRCAQDAGSSCPSGCYRVCMGGEAGCEGIPCQPVAKEVSYSASLTGNCLGEILKPAGSWKVTITSLEPNKAGPPFIAHGTLEGTVVQRSDAGTPATLTVTF